MGTNYYLLRKTNYVKGVATQYGCDCYDNKVTILNNGYVYDNTYYTSIQELNKIYYQKIHIGKSSCGWHFLLCTYKSLGLNSLEDWDKAFQKDFIIDENGNYICHSDMIDIITNRKIGALDDGHITLNEFEQEEVDKHNHFCEITGTHDYIHSYDELLRKNSAERGLNGLWAHHFDTIRTDGTYDLINGEEHLFS